MSGLFKPNEHIDVVKIEPRGRRLLFNVYGAISCNNLMLRYEEFKAALSDKAISHHIPMAYVDAAAAAAQPSREARIAWMKQGVPVERL